MKKSVQREEDLVVVEGTPRLGHPGTAARQSQETYIQDINRESEPHIIVTGGDACVLLLPTAVINATELANLDKGS